MTERWGMRVPRSLVDAASVLRVLMVMEAARDGWVLEGPVTVERFDEILPPLDGGPTSVYRASCDCVRSGDVQQQGDDR